METQIDLEVLLARLVYIKPEGVTYNDVVYFKNKAIKALRENGVHVVFYGVSKNALEETVKDYPDQFFMTSFPENTYYGYIPFSSSEYNQHYFDSRISKTTAKILDDVTEEYKQEHERGRAKIIEYQN